MTLDLQDSDGNYEQTLSTLRDRLGLPGLAFFAPLVAQMEAAPQPQLEGSEAKVWKALSLQEATSIDTLLAKLPLPTSEVYSALLTLELSEHVRQLPGKKYIRRL